MNEPLSIFNIKISSKQIFWFLTALTLCAALFRFMIAYATIHYYDLSYYVDWSTGVNWDFFGAYDTIDNLDYPPLFLFPLYITGKLMANDTVAEFHSYAMLALKGWQVLFDIAIIPLLYVVLRRYGKLIGLAGAVLWAVNPTAVLNSSYWGQTDSIMIFLLVLAFYFLTWKMPVLAGIIMTLACLMKFQSLYFAPLFALALLTKFKGGQIFRTIFAGGVTAAVIFLPFMVRSGWDLPWRIYFGGFERYPGATINAFNLYGALNYNFTHVDSEFIGRLTVNGFSYIVLALALILLVFLYFSASEKSVWLLGFLFMQTIFMFTTRMHERYQISVLAFALVACAVHRSRGLFASYLALTVMTFFNHFFIIEEVFAGDDQLAWVPHLETIIRVFSWLNLLLYVATVVIAVRILYRRGFSQRFRALLPPKGRRGSTPA